MTTQHAPNDRLWSEWLSRYLAHCRRELSGPQLIALANALDSSIRTEARPELDRLVPERAARVAGPLVDFIATAPRPEARMALTREAAIRLRAAARSR